MARFLVLWQWNPMAPWPADPLEGEKLNEMMFAGLDELIKKGEIVEFGMFPDAIGGFGISTGEVSDVFRRKYVPTVLPC